MTREDVKVNQWFGLVAKYGLGTVITLFLLGWLTTSWASQQADILAEARAVKAALAAHVTETAAVLQRLEDLAKTQTQLMRQICMNTAQNREQQLECVR